MGLARLAICHVFNSSSENIEHRRLHYPTILRHLQNLGAKFTIVGGVAVSIRTIERFTKDLDIVIAVESDSEAESIVHSLSRLGYAIDTLIEQDETKRLATVRFSIPGPPKMLLDILFASSGIEPEIVETAEAAEIFPGLDGLVATLPSLLALKVLSADNARRLQDIIDIQNILKETSVQDLEDARYLLDLITLRGFNRNKNLQRDLDNYIDQFNEL